MAFTSVPGNKNQFFSFCDPDKWFSIFWDCFDHAITSKKQRIDHRISGNENSCRINAFTEQSLFRVIGWRKMKIGQSSDQTPIDFFGEGRKLVACS